MAQAKQDKPKLPVVVKMEGHTYSLNALDLRIRERIALEEHLDQAYTAILQSSAIFSEKAIAYLGYLALKRRNPLQEYEAFLDLLDSKEASVTMQVGEEEEESEGEEAAEKSTRPTKPATRKTSGKPSTSK